MFRISHKLVHVHRVVWHAGLLHVHCLARYMGLLQCSVGCFFTCMGVLVAACTLVGHASASDYC